MYDSPSDTTPQLEAFLTVLRNHRKQIELQLEDIRVTLEEIAQHEARCVRLLEAATGANAAPASPARRAAKA
jgi:ABC-type transporter Mla subunit MlaD